MKLRNKRTGEIVNIEPLEIFNTYNSIKDFISDWEDAPEEPKEYWHIFGTNITKTQEGLDEVYDKRNKEIGNYFETKEEVEKAVKKLRAFKRLEDKGFEFEDWHEGIEALVKINGGFDIGYELSNQDEKDLDLLFGGEE